ncbi:MAG TPA: AI-2E family transporter [Bdellovibrionales bacterium]|nr:AI-2E family transporter [Bdellovibrionales bacterium]
MSEEKKGRTSLITFIGLLLLVTAFNAWMFLPYFTSILMGIILSLMFRPIFDRIIRSWKLKPSWAALLTTLAIVFLVIGPLTVFSIRAVKQGVALGSSVADNPEFSFQSIIHRIGEWGPIDTIIEDPAAFEAQVRSGLKNSAQAASGLVLKFAAQIPNFLLQLVLASLTCYFALVDGPRLRNWLSDKIPLEREVRHSLRDSFKDTAVSVIWATLAAASGQAVIMMIGYAVLGVPNVFLAGGATFIFAWIPMIGCTPVWALGAIYLYFQGSIAKAVIMVVIGLLASVADNFIRPIVLQGRSSMHPLVSLVAIFAGIKMFGLLGVFIGPIIVAILIAMLDAWPEVGRRFGLNFRNEAMKPAKK